MSPPFSSLSYALPDYLPAKAFFTGQRVAVPLGKGVRAGIITGVVKKDDRAEESFVLKPLLWPLEKEPLLSKGYLDLAVQLARRQTESVGRVLGGILPVGLRTAKARLRFFGDGKPMEVKTAALMNLPPEKLAAFGEFWLRGQVEVYHSGVSPLDAQICELASDPPWPVRPSAKAQNTLLEFLLENGSVSRRKVVEALGKGVCATLALLARRGLVRIRPADSTDNTPDNLLGGSPIVPSTFAPAKEEHLERDRTEQQNELTSRSQSFSLTPQQSAVFIPLLEATLRKQAETHLLFGITGSGKTAVYLDLARAVLNSGRSVLLLAPEVALALKLWSDANAALPLSVLPRERRHLFHGYQSAAMREKTFRTLARQGTSCGQAEKVSAQLLVGTRSALLLPLENIGLIILDEEHDSSFKQDEGFAYQAKEVAWYRAGTAGALLLLGSATPDVKSYYAASRGLFPLHVLSERVGGGTVPHVRLVPLAKKKAQMGATGRAQSPILAPESLDALKTTVERGEQAVLLLNRRGYAPLMYCQGCGVVAKCPHCDISLAYHKGRERLLCHYCGWSRPYPSPCASCASMHFLPMGEGTEKLEESLTASLPPGTRVLRLDRDSARRPGRMEEILATFARKEASVLVGTQMLSKGHHFPNVTLAIVADADLGLNLPDYRAAERTFQLLLQAAGRAGRGARPGTVLVQTRDPSHYCWEYLQKADYRGFFERELALRKHRRYPPFVRLGLIRISYPAHTPQGRDEILALGGTLRKKARELGIVLLGPAPAPLPFLKERSRWHCLLKGDDWQPLRALFVTAQGAAHKTSLRLRLDLDPVNML